MTAIPKTAQGDDDVYEAVDVVDGGQLVVPKTGATNPGKQGITPAGDAALLVLGVAARRAEPVASQNLVSTDGDGYPVTYPNPVNELTTVYKHCKVKVQYTAAAVGFGVKLCAAANGKVRAWVSGTDNVASIIGECRVVGGMSAAGGWGLAYIY